MVTTIHVNGRLLADGAEGKGVRLQEDGTCACGRCYSLRSLTGLTARAQRLPWLRGRRLRRMRRRLLYMDWTCPGLLVLRASLRSLPKAAESIIRDATGKD